VFILDNSNMAWQQTKKRLLSRLVCPLSALIPRTTFEVLMAVNIKIKRKPNRRDLHLGASTSFLKTEAADSFETFVRSIFQTTRCHIHLSMALQPFVGPWPLFGFSIFYRVGRTHWTGDQPVARPLPTHRKTQTQNKRTQAFMTRVG
jgi:hypothetical protein